jgi:RNA polymerase sigma-70 factor, ECF subfamily
MLIADGDLLKLLDTHPEKGLRKLMDAYMGLVYTIVQSKLTGGPREDIEECASDVFFEVYRGRASIDLNKGSLKAYLAVVAKRRAIDRFRSYKPAETHAVSLENLYHEPASEKESYNGTRDALINEINALGEPDREIFIRKYYLGQSTRTIAEALRLKENTVDKRVSRGLLKLRESLGRSL